MRFCSPKDSFIIILVIDAHVLSPQGVRRTNLTEKAYIPWIFADSKPRIGLVVVNRGSRGAAGSSHIASDRHQKQRVTCVLWHGCCSGQDCETRHTMLSSSLRRDNIGYSPMLTYVNILVLGGDVIVGPISPLTSLESDNCTDYTYPQYSEK